MALTTDIRRLLDDKLGESDAFYAVAGAGDLAVERLRTVPARLAHLRPAVPDPRDVAARAGGVYDELTARGKQAVARRRGAAPEAETPARPTAKRRTKKSAAGPEALEGGDV
jgi:hypothetical protein